MKTRKIIFLILIIINCITIFYFSNQVADTSSSSSGRVVNFVMKVLPQFKNMQEQQKEHIANEVLQPIVRKMAHFSIYTLLGFLTINFALACKEKTLVCNTDEQCSPLQLKEGRNKRILYSWLFGTLYAVSDEIHQLFISGRSCEFRDICIDSLGVLTGIIIMIIIIKTFNKIKKTLVGASIARPLFEEITQK